jgi:non-lysosomal glucosylceramidase
MDTIHDWPVVKNYDIDHLARIALPLGGIGTGTVSLGGRGNLRDWEIMNRPAKGFIPMNPGRGQPSFILNVLQKGESITRLIEGPLETFEYEGDMGSPAPNHGLPRFRQARFAAAYPLGQVFLSDQDVPVKVHLQAFNPMSPADAESSGLPVVVLRFTLTNRTNEYLDASICASLPNFIGMDGSQKERQWGGHWVVVGARQNKNEFRQGEAVRGILMTSDGVCNHSQAWGTIALATTAQEGITYRTSWGTSSGKWGDNLLRFWDDFSQDGELVETGLPEGDMPTASLAVKVSLPPNESQAITFLLTWHFPNRCTWTPQEVDETNHKCECQDVETQQATSLQHENCCSGDNLVGNYYTTKYTDAWDAAEKIAPRLEELEEKTLKFVQAICDTDLPEVVKEAALFNLTALRSQTSFRTADGRFFGWEGCCDNQGCCHGSCTHVWNYEQATAFLFGSLARSMRETEFGHSTAESGIMAFRTSLPLERARDWLFAAADGQMGTIMKMYRDWQLSGDDAFLKELWPMVKQALAFAWRPGGWDADQDGVMEGCQHNTMDVEYYGPNPQMESWYLGALRAAEKMAWHLGDEEFANRCHELFQNGRLWTDANLFNGEYYEHKIVPPKEVAEGLRLEMGARDLSKPDYQLGSGCLVDQLVGQYMAHICGLGYLLDADHVKQTLKSIMKYNHKEDFSSHFNCMRSFVLGDEAALLMASYPGERPEIPFSYFTEVMTGFEYTAAVGMLYEGMLEDGMLCIRNVRERYDGLRRSPFDEAECGHHYARAMASWAALLALTGFRYSAVDKMLEFKAQEGRFFWSTGYAWGMVNLCQDENGWIADLEVFGGKLKLRRLDLFGVGSASIPEVMLQEGESYYMIRIQDKVLKE